MRLHFIQHVPFEGIANIQGWAENQGCRISGTHLYRLEKLPGLDELDWLVVMGGPMNIYEDNEYPWLSAEKKFIGAAIEKGKIVLGICLGAQLIADVLGGQVVRNRYKEIGWFPVSLGAEGLASVPFRGLPGRIPGASLARRYLLSAPRGGHACRKRSLPGPGILIEWRPGARPSVSPRIIGRQRTRADSKLFR